ncbi:abnormal spindle-like microcephaly-associated protein homolog isoform X2 [Neltuma alba]|uniref:abnormal spindle-like microcephaly-associated protein homolog isoform X2 n=1 Tax=Neltuma alba TaxID=207710 RepID=UPI0010A515EE|nr:abnormal spindle-like microcephaly-associated protein homolog isoform X2 [Prosopis alba]
MDGDEPPCPSPHVSSSSIFKDISNFKTPKRPSYNLNFQSPCQKFFTASKQTPHSSAFRRRPSVAPPSSARTKKSAAAARKLKAFELEQSQSSRKAQIKKEQSLKSLAKSITVWLNFLFENPATCGCNLSIGGIRMGDKHSEAEATKGKRDSGPGISIGVDKAWRTPKRQRKIWSRAEDNVGNENTPLELPNSMFSHLRESLEDVCSFDDLKQRMRIYLNLGSCKEIFEVMNQVTKNIDEGRLKLKPHCPIVTDLGLKNKATRILMSYNPIWLRIGLYIIFGGDSLVPNGDDDSEQEITFLKMVIDKQFFSHAGLAKAYAYNKMVDGLYRPGYYENLGNVILKRILLIVLTLDRIKSQSCLSLKYGIDGLDGGSPLLFKADSWIKSSGQVISEFLSSEVMHGEGNLLAHLVIIGYKVSHQQGPLVEYDFKVRDLFVDLQDGLKLCRAIQLLQHDSSILTKIVVPSDTYKKNLANCGLALQYLKKAGVLLHDEDNMMIEAEDVANGDKELVLSLLWNIFVHLQLPLLVDKSCLLEEIGKIRGLGVNAINNANSSSLELLLNWIQAVCANYDCGVDNFDSLVDGKAIWCLLDYYFQKEFHSSCLMKEVDPKSGKESIMSVNDYSDAVYNFILSQRLTTLLGNFPEVLQISDLLEYNGASSDRSVVILLVFLARQLFVKKNDQLNFHKLLGCDCQSLYRKHLRMEQCLSNTGAAHKPDASDVHDNEDAAKKFKAIQAWWQLMAERNQKSYMKPAACRPIESSANVRKETAAITIQSRFRRLVARRTFLKMHNAVSLLQTVFRAWLEVRQESSFSFVQGQNFSCAIHKRPETHRRDAMFFVQRHSFLKLKRSALLIQQAVRSWLSWRHQQECSILPQLTASDPVAAATTVQKFVRGWMARSRYNHMLEQQEKASYLYSQKVMFELQTKAAIRIQLAWKRYMCCKFTQRHFCATIIQSSFRRWRLRRIYLNQIQAVLKIQCYFRMSASVKTFQHFKMAFKAAIVIQSFTRAWIARKEAYARRSRIVSIQRHCRAWLARRDFMCQRGAAMKIQTVILSLKYQKALNCRKDAVLQIQRFIRGHLSRNRLLGGASRQRAMVPSGCILRSAGYSSFQLELYLCSVLKLQRWWRGVLLHKLRTKSVVIIQSCTRGWIARRMATVRRHHVIVIQSHWKGYLARKESREQLRDLRLRVKKSARNVDDSKRLINRLLLALSELLHMKSVSGILHTCATLDMATEHSQKCCEELVAAGAIDKLLTLIRSVSRSIPDQEVLKHALSTLRNLARYPHLLELLIQSNGSMQTILWELLRNKEDSYFIASELLMKISSTPKGVESLRKLPALVKRLHALVEELTRKGIYEKRNGRAPSAVIRENRERRLKEAAGILKLITNA